MRIATWNLARPVNPTGRRIKAITAINHWMDEVAADVWVLTETHDSVSPGTEYSSVSTIGTDQVGDPGERFLGVDEYPWRALGEKRLLVRTQVDRIGGYGL